MQIKNLINTSKSTDNRAENFPTRQYSPEQPRAPGEDRCKSLRSQDELRKFVNRHVDAIYEKARLLCYGSEENAMEVLQELYPKLLVVLARSPEGLRNPWAVIHRVMRRLAIDCHRKCVRRNRIKELPDCVAETRHDLSHDADTIHSAIQSLSPRLQAVVLGIFVEGCKAKDVAARINLSESRVAELKREALLKIGGALGGSAK